MPFSVAKQGGRIRCVLPVFFRIDSLAQSAFAVGIGIPTLDEVADGNPDKGNHNIGDPKRPHAAVVEQENGGQKKKSDQNRVMQVQTVFSSAQDAADQADQREKDKEGQRHQGDRVEAEEEDRRAQKSGQGDDGAVHQFLWIFHKQRVLLPD